MKLTYFFAPVTCSLAGMLALEALGCAYEARCVDLAGDRSDLRAVSPMGRVPVLVADGEVIIETIAILMWLDQAYPSGTILPRDPAALVRTLSLMSWCASTLHILRRRFARPMMFADSAAGRQDVQRSAEAPYRSGVLLLDEALGRTPRSLALDAYALVFLQWAVFDGVAQEDLPNLRGVAAEMARRPGTERALAAHRTPSLLGNRETARV